MSFGIVSNLALRSSKTSVDQMNTEDKRIAKHIQEGDDGIV